MMDEVQIMKRARSRDLLVDYNDRSTQKDVVKFLSDGIRAFRDRVPAS